MSRSPLPPFTEEAVRQKARAAEDAWNISDPAKVVLAVTPDSRWPNRAEFPRGRTEIEAFLGRKWRGKFEPRLMKELWSFHLNRIAVRFAYDYHDDSRQWFRAYGNENWQFDVAGLMKLRIASINRRGRTPVPLTAWSPARRSPEFSRYWGCNSLPFQGI